MAMFPFKWSDGTWRDGPEPTSQPQPRKPKQPPRGFFKDYKRMSRREVALKASNARQWLEYTLYDGPRLAKEVLRLAKLEGLSEYGVRRAKRHYGIKSIRTGGKGTGRRNPWIWQFPVQTD